MSVETMYDEKPPSHNYIRNALIIAFLVGLVCLFLAPLLSCNTAKHIDKKIHKFNQKDAAAVRKTLSELYPPDTVIKVKQGKPIVTTHIIKDSSQAKKLAKKIDSLFNENQLLFQSLSAKQIDVDSLRDAITNEVMQGCPTFNELDTVFRVDTTVIIPDKVQVQLRLIPDLQKQITQKDQQISDLKSDRNRWLFSTIGELILILLLTYLLIKSFLKQKAKTIV